MSPNMKLISGINRPIPNTTWSWPKKKLILAGTIAALISSPAFAQAYIPSLGSGNFASPNTETNPNGPVSYAPDYRGGDGAYAQAPTGSNSKHAASAYAYAPGNRASTKNDPTMYMITGWTGGRENPRMGQALLSAGE
jgi:hypothetical protein